MGASPTERLLQAIERRDAADVERLLDAHPYLARGRGADGTSVLMLTIYHRLGDATAALVARGAVATLHEAAALGDGEALVRIAGDVTGFSPDGFTPLHLAAHFGHAHLVPVLVARGGDVAAVSRNALANTPLHAAAAGGSAAAARALLAAGAPVDARDAGGHTALHVAAGGGAEEVVRALLHAGADRGAVDGEGRTPADVARERDEDEVADLLAGAVQ